MSIETGFETEIINLEIDMPKDFGFNRKADWAVEFGGSISAGITLHEGKLFFGCADYHLYCFDAKTGKELWRFKANDVNDTSYPIVADGIVYSGFFDGYLYAVNEKDGKLIWKFKTGDRVTGTPTICNNFVVFGSWDEFVYALDKKTGEEIWRFKTGDRVGCTPTFDGEKIYIGSFDGCIYCLDLKGREIWRFKTGGSMFNYHQQPIKDGIMYFTNWDGHLYALNTKTGQEEWRFKMGKGSGVTPLVYENRIYFGSWDKNFYCIDLNGKEIWRFRAKDILEDFKALIHDGKVYFGSIDKNFYAFDIRTGELIWSFQTNDTIWSTAVYFEGLIIFGGWDCFLYALDYKTGAEVWRSVTSTKNAAKHVLEVKYSYGGKIRIAKQEEGDEGKEDSEINIGLSNDVYNFKSEYATDSTYSGSKRYG
ncbi:MAG: PQQ-binding-like beta-propeller repeat protein [Candidatus Aenigmarchaeota archaeon]|nr:PQQ-binding-like beta-propeller repeat protein [Candidatus Aenigmarchaeota archaeon]